MFKVDNKASDNIAEIKGALDTCEMLLAFEIQEEVNSIALIIVTDEKQITYRTHGENQTEEMLDFLKNLQKEIPDFSDDIAELLQDLVYMHNTTK